MLQCLSELFPDLYHGWGEAGSPGDPVFRTLCSTQVAVRPLPPALAAPQLLQPLCHCAVAASWVQTCMIKLASSPCPLAVSRPCPSCHLPISHDKHQHLAWFPATSAEHEPFLPCGLPQLGSMFLGPDFCHLLLDDKLGFTYCVLKIEKSVDYLQPLTVIWFKQRP